MNSDLFDVDPAGTPLAERVRPRTLDDVVGQDHLLGEGGAIRRALRAGRLPSLILWGPPGTGKTTIARLLADAIGARFVALSAVMDGVAKLREVVDAARGARRQGRATLLFVDEIHRFHKGQQDALLPHVEDGTFTLVGATTENPSFALTGALASRAMVLVLQPLADADVVRLLERALAHPRGLGETGVSATPAALERLARAADGDARRALGDLEALCEQRMADAAADPTIDAVLDEDALQRAGGPRYDKGGTEHFHVLSAFIKSMRASDPDAALYYLARMLEGGEDGRVICRRMVVFAAEDVGNADPRALPLAVATAQSHEMTGLPESRIAMAQCVTFLATAPKSNASYKALGRAIEAVRSHGALPVPNALRNPSTALGKRLGWGQGYAYPHDYGGFVAESTLPEALVGARFYEPSQNGYDARIGERLAQWRALREQAADPNGDTDAEEQR
ncbi:MAG: replication-associated recombination protein A [Deltaproteobacteria bacterium]|nr:replication-associated recombination protein A [Deltaproteobacteria bacterium]